METDTVYNFLGRSSVSVSNICLGTMTFGHANVKLGKPAANDEELSHKIMDRFVELGGNFIDTANVYHYGESEKIIGSWLTKQQREKIVLSTKVIGKMDATNPNSRGLNRKNIIWSLEESLRRLKTDYVDLFQIHYWDCATDLEETLRTMNDLVISGKVRYVGASNVSGWQMQKIMDYCKFMGLNKWVSLQTQYNLLHREVELELTDVCRHEGLGILPWSPLKGGWLTGKIKKGMTQAPAGSRIAFAEERPEVTKYDSFPNFTTYGDERVWRVLDTVEEIAKETGKTMSQVAIRWLLQKDTVCSVVIGVKTIAQLEDNMGAAKGWELTEKQMATLDEAGAQPLSHPYNLLARTNMDRKRTNWCR